MIKNCTNCGSYIRLLLEEAKQTGDVISLTWDSHTNVWAAKFIDYETGEDIYVAEDKYLDIAARQLLYEEVDEDD